MKAVRGARDMRERSTQEVVKEDCHVAAEVRAKLAERIGPERFGLWFGAQTQLVIEGDLVTVRAASVFVRDLLRQNFSDDLHDCAQEVVDRKLTLAFEVEPSLLLNVARPAFRAEGHSAGSHADESALGSESPFGVATAEAAPSRRGPATKRVAAAKGQRSMRQLTLEGLDAESPAPTDGKIGAAKAPTSATIAAATTTPGARADASLARFVVGASNEYAFRTAELTATGRQQASPVMFHGRTGVGKTHLLRGLHGEYRRRFPRNRAVYLSAEQFTTAFIEALRGSGLPSFRQKCRDADLLVVDDLQFFAGKRRTIEELLHTVDTMLHAGRQLVLSSDRPLVELQGLGPELVSRLSGGLVCEIAAPEYVTRVRILRAIGAEMNLSLSEDVLSLIASQITAGARELRGAVHRLDAMSYAFRAPVSREMAEDALREVALQCRRVVRLADVQQAVCEVFGVEGSQLKSDRKGRALSEPRMLAMWLARKYTRAAWSEIGEFFGRRSHSTVISAHHRVEKMIASQAVVDIDARSCEVEEAIRRVEAVLRTA